MIEIWHVSWLKNPEKFWMATWAVAQRLSNATSAVSPQKFQIGHLDFRPTSIIICPLYDLPYRYACYGEVRKGMYVHACKYYTWWKGTKPAVAYKNVKEIFYSSLSESYLLPGVLVTLLYEQGVLMSWKYIGLASVWNRVDTLDRFSTIFTKGSRHLCLPLVFLYIASLNMGLLWTLREQVLSFSE